VTKTTTVKVVSATISTPFSVCTIGDSLANTKAWQPELISLSSGFISLKGTRGSIVSGVQRTHEGRSGATSSYYLGNNSYTFDSNGTVGNDGRTQDLNPFWNPATSDVDFAYYKSNYNQNPDKLLIWLGTNGIAVDATSNATNIKTFIDKIRLTGGSTIPIFVVHTLFRGNQDGIGVQTGSDGYVANSTYKLEEDLKVFNLQEKILADLSAYSNLYLVPVSTCHDSEFNFGAVSTPVNPRASQVEYLPSEATHPQNQGYLQIADIIFSSLAANQ
jgi:lysophospholipase L1-like esterase